MSDSDQKTIILSAKSPYQVLGVKETTNLDEITRAYRRLMLKFHPDKNSDSDSTEISTKINKAYECIISHIQNPLNANNSFKSCHQLKSPLPRIIQLLHLNDIGGLTQFVSNTNYKEALSNTDNNGFNIFHHLMLFFSDDYDFTKKILEIVTPHLSINTPSTKDKFKLTPLHFFSMISVHTMSDIENKIKLLNLFIQFGADVNSIAGLYSSYDGENQPRSLILFKPLDFVDLTTEGCSLKNLYMASWKEKGALHYLYEQNLSLNERIRGMLFAFQQIDLTNYFQTYRPSFLQSLISSSKYTLPIIIAIGLLNYVNSNTQSSTSAQFGSSFLLIAGGTLFHQLTSLPEIFNSYSELGYHKLHSKILKEIGQKLGGNYGLFQQPRQMILAPSAIVHEIETQHKI